MIPCTSSEGMNRPDLRQCESTHQKQIYRHLFLLVAECCLNSPSNTLGRIAEQCTPSSLSTATRDTSVECSCSRIDTGQSIAVIGPQFAMGRCDHVGRHGRGRHADLRDEGVCRNGADDIFYVVGSIQAECGMSELLTLQSYHDLPIQTLVQPKLSVSPVLANRASRPLTFVRKSPCCLSTSSPPVRSITVQRNFSRASRIAAKRC